MYMPTKPTNPRVPCRTARDARRVPTTERTQVDASSPDPRVQTCVVLSPHPDQHFIDLHSDFTQQSKFAERIGKAAQCPEDRLAAHTAAATWQRAANLIAVELDTRQTNRRNGYARMVQELTRPGR